MADISRESCLGAGQIYRYFSSKEAIVSETIKNIAKSWRIFLQVNLPQQTSADSIIDDESPFWEGWSFQDRCLLLEMYSEASRNLYVREIIAHEEQLLVAELIRAFEHKMPMLSLQARIERIQFLLMLVDGVACRAFGEKRFEQQELKRIDDILSRHLFQ